MNIFCSKQAHFFWGWALLIIAQHSFLDFCGISAWLY